MTLEENRTVVRRVYEEVHGGNLDTLSELVDEDCMLHGWTSTQRVTLEEARQMLEGQRSAFPDWKVTVGELIRG
jgi:hypothetical protein